MGKHGGAREGAGRPKGAVTVRSREVAASAVETGVTPLEVMLENMRFAHERSEEILTKLLSLEGEPAEGFDTLKELLRFRKMAQECATDAAPYIHPRLAAIADLRPQEPEEGGMLKDAPRDTGEDHLASLAKRYAGGLRVIDGGQPTVKKGKT